MDIEAVAGRRPRDLVAVASAALPARHVAAHQEAEGEGVGMARSRELPRTRAAAAGRGVLLCVVQA